MPNSILFTDTAGTTPANFGQSVARVKDGNLDRRPGLQSSTALRPLAGRAPIGAAPGGPIDQGSGPTFLRFDLSDDRIAHTFPNGFTGDVMLFGRNGSYIEENVTIAPNGVLNIGPRAVAGGIPGSLDACGDIVGWLPVGREITAQERQYMVDYYKERGAKGLLVPGPELVTNGDFSDGLTGWGGQGSWEIVDGRATVAPESTSGFPILQRSGFGLSFSRFYLYTIESNRNSLNRMALGTNLSSGNISRRVRPFGSHWIHEGISPPLIELSRVGFQFSGTSIGSWIDNVSVRELRPQEEW
jgi:hypothetical protein